VKRAKAIVEATTHYNDADIIARVSRDLGEAMVGINISDIPDAERMQERGW
ncbi:MAG: pyridoxal 5'-phosphate synthase lyase subunit PdxS, partial [Coriobacteriia bacterium]